jgi:hypothetical protein
MTVISTTYLHRPSQTLPKIRAARNDMKGLGGVGVIDIFFDNGAACLAVSGALCGSEELESRRAAGPRRRRRTGGTRWVGDPREMGRLSAALSTVRLQKKGRGVFCQRWTAKEKGRCPCIGNCGTDCTCTIHNICNGNCYFVISHAARS